jgi:hydroxyacylglutathione hydrolase
MEVTIIPQLADNFCYHISFVGASILVDCSEPDKVFSYLGGRTVSHLLTTHKHWDHSNGNVEMKSKIPGLEIVGGKEDNVPACTLPVENGDTLQVDGVKITCIHTPCHTRGHIIYLLEVAAQEGHTIDRDVYQVTRNVKQALFTGDTIFIGGCGRFFEGQPNEMVHAMEEARKFPDALVFCGHEYSI